MAFDVDPPTVTAFASAMWRLAASTRAASEYTDRYLRQAAGQTGVLRHSTQDAIEAVRAFLLASLSRTHELADASAAELYAAAEMYRSTDRTAAAELDATIPPR